MREATRARYLLTPQAVMAKGITLDLAFETRTIRGGNRLVRAVVPLPADLLSGQEGSNLRGCGGEAPPRRRGDRRRSRRQRGRAPMGSHGELVEPERRVLARRSPERSRRAKVGGVLLGELLPRSPGWPGGVGKPEIGREPIGSPVRGRSPRRPKPEVLQGWGASEASTLARRTSLDSHDSGHRKNDD